MNLILSLLIAACRRHDNILILTWTFAIGNTVIQYKIG